MIHVLLFLIDVVNDGIYGPSERMLDFHVSFGNQPKLSSQNVVHYLSRLRNVIGHAHLTLFAVVHDCPRSVHVREKLCDGQSL